MTDTSDCEKSPLNPASESAEDRAKWLPRVPVLRRRAEEILALRQRRYAVFGRAMFGEPAWDMILLLYVAAPGSAETVSKLASLAAASKSTGLRWIKYLEAQCLIRCASHSTDRRAEVVSLTSKGVEAIESYLRETMRDCDWS